MIGVMLALSLAQSAPAASAAPVGVAVIRNSGSTNAAGYTVAVAPDGTAMVRQGDSVTQKVIGAPQTRWLFLKLQQAAPLDALAAGHCMKSASFGTSTTITWNDRTSSDLSCGDDPLARELERTIGVIVRALDIHSLRPIRRLRPI